MEAFINEMVEPRVFDLIVLILPKWRLLVYIFLMNIVIYAPVYVFGALLAHDPEDLELICPSAMLVGFSLVYRAVFRFNRAHHTRTLLLGVAVLSLGISASGLVAMYTAQHYLLVVLLYSAVGGFGHQLVFSRVWKILAKIFNARKEMFVIKFLHSCGQATSLLLLLAGIQLPWEGYIYGALLLLLGGALLHLVPLAMLVAGEKGRLQRHLDALVRLTEKGNESYYAHVATRVPCEEPGAAGCPTSSGREPPPVTWKNPASFSTPPPRSDVLPGELRAANVPPPVDCEYEECDESLPFRRDAAKCYNQDGVEILEMILEEDEPVGSDDPDTPDTRRSSDSTVVRSGPRAPPTTKWRWLSVLGAAVTRSTRCAGFDPRPNVNLRLLASARSTLGDVRCCCCALLKATDTCVLVLFLAILPRLGRRQHMALLAVVVIAAAWAAASVLLLWCELRFRKQQERLLACGLLFQTGGYCCVYTARSGLWIAAGCVLIGTGRALTCLCQEAVVKRQLGQHRWNTAKAGIGLLAGLTVIAVAALANVLYVYGPIEQVLLCLLLVYGAATVLWIACSCRIFFI
uniref:Major facilitator superfamily associated domain-containing protein n=1 Tax=Anopheles dirus TaxID=7168 RepID=A0A182MZP4_9DIPT